MRNSWCDERVAGLMRDAPSIAKRRRRGWYGGACYRRKQAVDVQETAAAPVRTDAEGSAAARVARSWKLVLAYDGTDFHGWQVQPGLRTVQGELARVLFAVTGERVLPQGSGRTDTGVHAEAQVVSVELMAAIPAERLRTALNRRLPAAVRVVSAEVVSGFHARSEVLRKTYEYRLFLRRGSDGDRSEEGMLLPWQARFVWDCREPLRLDAMQEAAGAVVGTHDFSSFAACDPDRSKRLAGPDAAVSNVRTIFTSAWLESDGLLLYRVSGSGFLHHMVRNLVGTFAEVGSGRRTAAWVSEVLAARERRAAGPTAPPQGLFLMDVVYGSSVAAEAAVCGSSTTGVTVCDESMVTC